MQTSSGAGGRPTDRTGLTRRTAARLTVAAKSKSARTELVVIHRRRLTDAAGALWFKPALAIVGAVALGAALSQVHVSPDSLLWKVSFHATSNDARQMLTVIIGGMIPVTSLVFALTVVTLQIASTQFSPRLLRTFLRDPGAQVTLGAFVGTVAYCLTAMFTISTDTVGPTVQVPRFAITVALLFALGCIAILVYYIFHITDSVRIDTVMRQVETDARRTLERDHPLVDDMTADPDRCEVVAPPDDAVTLLAPCDGYMQGVDAELLGLAVRKAVNVHLLQLVGYYVVTGRELAVVWSDDGSPLKPTTLGAIASLIEIDPERRVEREVGLGLRQLVDITNRAMSTGQNDPYTATQAVHHLTSLLVGASRRSFATQQLRDDDGKVRVTVPIMTFPTHMKVVCGHVRQGGLERHPRVVIELIRMLAAIGEAVKHEGRAQAIRRELDVVIADASRMIQTQVDLDEVLAAGRETLQRLDQRDASASSAVV